jgi:TctA family transporter
LTMLIIHNINDKYMLAGCLCGLIIGVLVGLNAYYRIMNNYRELISSYR